MKAYTVGFSVFLVGAVSGTAPIEASGPMMQLLIDQGPLGLAVAFLYRQTGDLQDDLDDLRTRLTRLEAE